MKPLIRTAGVPFEIGTLHLRNSCPHYYLYAILFNVFGCKNRWCITTVLKQAKIFPCAQLIKHYTMKAYGGVNV
jgi:hypothetical protein